MEEEGGGVELARRKVISNTFKTHIQTGREGHFAHFQNPLTAGEGGALRTLSKPIR